jgi:outer membrane receptor protein involved in Fe transport
MSITFKKSAVYCATLAALAIGTSAMAEETTKDTAKPAAADLERIVVTGNTGRGQTILESSISVTSLGPEQLAREMALGTADLLESVPGFWVEDSGGETNNNVAPRGLRGG